MQVGGTSDNTCIKKLGLLVVCYFSSSLSSSLCLSAGFWANTVSTLSTLSRASKNGRRSRSSVSCGSSNQDVTGICMVARYTWKYVHHTRMHAAHAHTHSIIRVEDVRCRWVVNDACFPQVPSQTAEVLDVVPSVKHTRFPEEPHSECPVLVQQISDWVSVLEQFKVEAIFVH